MCGIVGYVGTQSAQDVVVAGLKRLEYRGYDSAGVAVLADGGWPPRRRRGSSSTWRRSSRTGRCRPGTPGSGTPVGPRTAGPPTSTRTRTWTTRAGSPWCTTGSSRTSRRCARSWRPGPRPGLETDTEVVAHLLAEAYSSCGDPAEAMRQVCRQLEGAFTLVAVHADEPDVVVGPGGTRRSSSGWGTARCSSPPTWPPSSRTPGTRSSWARTRWSSCGGTERRSPASTAGPPTCAPTTWTGTRRPRRRAATPPSCSRRSPTSPRPSPTPCSAGSTARAPSTSTRCAFRRVCSGR